MVQHRPAAGARMGSFAEFWPYYLREHAGRATRGLHYAGTSLTFVAASFALAFGGWWWLAVPVAGYGFAWSAHVLVERNRPATFRHPLWSLAADYCMFFLWLAGRLGPHLAKAGVAAR